jgi:phytoene/squalene synthetase
MREMMTSKPAIFTGADWYCPEPVASDRRANDALAARITKAASKQTYYTVRYLVDRDRVPSAYRTYAYFRWVDDCLDECLTTPAERLAFVTRQQVVMEQCYAREQPPDLSAEEKMLAELVQSDQEPDSGLHAYLKHMMAVMRFDAERRGQVVSHQMLHDYTNNLAVAVTEALHYFIGHGQYAPQDETRYDAVTGAHITHMLRDTREDIAAGYFNIPREFLEAHHIDAWDVHRDAYRLWVEQRVQQARACFEAGKRYLTRVENRRCRLAGYAYMARFQIVLDTIIRKGYQLRPAYPERRSLGGGLRMAGSLFSMLVRGQ